VTADEFERLLSARLRVAQLQPDRSLFPALYTFFQLLARWNRRINLTSLPLNPPSDATFDRLLVEPLAAAAVLSDVPAGPWFDLGSGGGSPAIPLKLARPVFQLTMVDVRERKGAFLREASRTLRLDAEVLVMPFQELRHRDATLVTARAVRTDAAFLRTARHLLRPGGTLAVFGSTCPVDDGYDWRRPIALAAIEGSQLFRGAKRAA
jgi:16S rRNA (guanine527-N7)-methyltransferase